MILILMRTWCPAPPAEKALVSALNCLQAFIFPDILIIYENKNKTALLACQMEIFKEENGKKLFVAEPENPTLIFRICLFGLKKAGKD